MTSIITPCYNASRFLHDCIRSLIAQTYTDWELLIVDDCSTDNSADIIREYAVQDGRIRYLKTEKPSGSPVLPRNIGIKHARGRYIAFLDSDDAWMPTKLEEQMKLFEDEETCIVYSNYEKITEKGERNGRFVIAPPMVTYHRLLKGNVIGNLTGIYDTGKVGKIYCRNIPHEDYVVWLSILKQGYIARNTNTVNALYRIRKSSVSGNKKKVLLWQWNIYRNIEQLSVLKSVYYFLNYAYRAFKKSRI